MQRQSYPTETVLSKKITWNRVTQGNTKPILNPPRAECHYDIILPQPPSSIYVTLYKCFTPNNSIVVIIKRVIYSKDCDDYNKKL